MIRRILFCCAFILPTVYQSSAQVGVTTPSRPLTGDEANAKADREYDQRQLSKTAGTDPVNVANVIPPQVTEPCLTQVMRPDTTFNVQSIPLADWLSSSGDVTQIPWKVRVSNPESRVDQRFEVAYSAAIRQKDLSTRPGPNGLVFLSGVKTAEKDILPAKPERQNLLTGVSGDSKVEFSDCVFFRPGEYVLWMALYDPATGRHNVSKHRIRIPAIANDPVPAMDAKVPAAEFPVAFGYDARDPETPPAKLLLPVANTLTVRVDLVVVSSASDQWVHRPDIVRWTQNRVLAATGVLEKLQLAHGSVEAVALDLNSRTVPFEQPNVVQLNWVALAQTLTHRTAALSATVPELARSTERSSFFRDFMSGRLRSCDPARVVILISGTTKLPPGSDLSPLKLDAGCRCNMYHLRFQVNKDDVFDDLGRIIQSPKTRTFTITSTYDMRRAIAGIVHDLEMLPP